MTNVFDYYHLPETPFLEQLAQELERTLRNIAFAGHEKKKDYISSQQKYFRQRFGPFIDNVLSDEGIFHIIPAYDVLQELLERNPTPEEIRRTAEECLYEHLDFEGYSEDQLNAFSKFNQSGD